MLKVVRTIYAVTLSTVVAPDSCIFNQGAVVVLKFTVVEVDAIVMLAKAREARSPSKEPQQEVHVHCS